MEVLDRLLIFYLLVKVGMCLQKIVDNTKIHIYDMSRQLITMEVIIWITEKKQSLQILNG